MRVKRTSGNKAYTYIYNGDMLRYMEYDSNTTDNVAAAKLYFTFDASGLPISVNYTPENSTTSYLFYYVHNLQGDVEGLVHGSTGNVSIWYSYDAWGNTVVSGHMPSHPGADTLININPFRYRSYVYDSETELYYLQSRYYDPEMGRFINADTYISTGQGILGNNMFAYCNNNSINGHDRLGKFFTPTESQVKATYVFAPGQRGTALQQIQQDAGNFAGQLVVDVSVSVQANRVTYRKYGAAFVVDFERTEINMYPHIGAGIGLSSGPSVAVGYVGNYKKPDDYARDFLDVNAGYFIGLDHCYNPYVDHNAATQATAITFGYGFNVGVGYDFYMSPILIAAWEG